MHTKSYLQDEIKWTLQASQEDVSKGVQMMNNTLETLAKKEKLIFFSKFLISNLSVRTKSDLDGGGVCERKPNHTPKEHDYWHWLCLY